MSTHSRKGLSEIIQEDVSVPLLCGSIFASSSIRGELHCMLLMIHISNRGGS